MNKHYEVAVTVQGATPPRGKPVIELTYIVKACCPQVARAMALEYARATKAKHPRKYKNAVFYVADDKIRLFC